MKFQIMPFLLMCIYVIRYIYVKELKCAIYLCAKKRIFKNFSNTNLEKKFMITLKFFQL